MGVVRYRYRSGLESFAVAVPGAFATVAELKRLIAATGRHGCGRARGRGPREGIALCDPRTGEEYADESTLIPQNSTVLVHRVAGHPTDAIVASPMVIRNDGMVPNRPVTESTSESNAITETDDKEMTAIRTMIDAAELVWRDSSSEGGHAGGRLGFNHDLHTLEAEAPPPGYVCRICHVPGHFIRHCRKALPPGYVCCKCGVPGHFIQLCPTNGNRKYDSRRSCSLIPVVSSLDDGIPTELIQAMSSSVGDSLPAELHCPLCKKVMEDAMLTSKCCYDSFCDKCIRSYIIAHLKCICGAKILTDDLIPNQTLRSTITSMLSSRDAGFSNGTGKLTSSSNSNLDGKSHSFTASAALKGNVKQHMDNISAITTEGSCLVTAFKDPADHQTPSDLHSRTGKSAISTKKTIATADALEAVPEPRYQNQPASGVAVVSGALELKVIKPKPKKKQKTAGATGSCNTNYAGYDFHIPFDPSCYNSFRFGGPTWGSDPYNMYCMLNMPSSSYPMGLFNVNGINNLPLHAPWMQGYPVSHFSNSFSREFQPTVHQDLEASAHARQAECGKGTGIQSRKSERYHSCTSAHKRGSRSRSRSISERRDSSVESHDSDEEFHGRKKVQACSAPRDEYQRRSRKSRSRYSYRSHAREDSTSSDEDSNFKRGW